MTLERTSFSVGHIRDCCFIFSIEFTCFTTFKPLLLVLKFARPLIVRGGLWLAVCGLTVLAGLMRTLVQAMGRHDFDVQTESHLTLA